MSESVTPPTYEPSAWHLELIDGLRDRARELRSEANRLDALAAKIQNPPAGVRVEYDGRDTVRFVGPALSRS